MRILASSVLSLAVACGGGGVHHVADSGADSPFRDAPAPDAAEPGLVTVTVTLQGSAIAGAPVYFQNDDSSLVLETTTDASGSASATMKAGGFVTVLEPNGAGAFAGSAGGTVSTFAGVKPGDHLLDDVQPLLQSTSVTFDLVAPIDTLGGSAVAGYQVFPSCGGVTALNGPAVGVAAGSNLPPTQLTLFNCNGSADMIVGSFDVNGNAIDSFFAGGVAVENDNTVTVTGTYAPASVQTFTITDVPPEVSNNININAELVTARGPLINGFTNTPGAGSASLLALTRDPAVDAAYAFNLSPVGTIKDQQTLVTWGPQPASVTEDIGTSKLRSWLTAAQVDPIKGQLGWVVATTGIEPDFLLADVDVSRSTAAGTTSWTWRLASGPGTDGAMPFPTLPTDIFDFNFRDTDNTFVNELFGVASPGGYDVARPEAIDAFNLGVFNNPLQLATLSASGTLAVQDVVPLELPAVRHASRTPTFGLPRWGASVLDGAHALGPAR